jgi:hypothetical protein
LPAPREKEPKPMKPDKFDLLFFIGMLLLLLIFAAIVRG